MSTATTQSKVLSPDQINTVFAEAADTIKVIQELLRVTKESSEGESEYAANMAALSSHMERIESLHAKLGDHLNEEMKGGAA